MSAALNGYELSRRFARLRRRGQGSSEQGALFLHVSEGLWLRRQATQRSLGADLALAKTERKVVRVSDSHGNAGAIFWADAEAKWVVVEFFTDNTRFPAEVAVVMEKEKVDELFEVALLTDLDNGLWVVDAQDLEGFGEKVEVLWRG